MTIRHQVLAVIRLSDATIDELVACTGYQRKQIKNAVERLSGMGKLEPLGGNCYTLGHHEKPNGGKAVDNS